MTSWVICPLNWPFFSLLLFLPLVAYSVCAGIFIVYSMYRVAFIKLFCSVLTQRNIFIFIQLFSLLVWLIGKLLACHRLFFSLYAINFPLLQFLFAFLLVDSRDSIGSKTCEKWTSIEYKSIDKLYFMLYVCTHKYCMGLWIHKLLSVGEFQRNHSLCDMVWWFGSVRLVKK